MTILRSVAALLLLYVIWIGVTFALPAGELRDYGSFIASGRAAAEGKDPYGIYPLTFHVVLPGFDVWNPNLNPPVSLPPFQLLDLMPPHAGFTIWWIVSALCFAGTIVLLARARGGRGTWLLVLWGLALAGFWDTLALGQIYLPLVLAAVAAWLLLERGHPRAAGILIGLVIAVKPNFAVWPVLLLLAGHVPVAATAAITFLALWTLPLLAYGPTVYRQWFEVVAGDTGRGAFLTNASLAGLAQRMDIASAGTLLSAGLLVALAWWAWRHRPDAIAASTAGLLGGILASPIAWVHYTLFLLPIFFLQRRWPPAMLGAAALLVVPVPWALSALGAPAWQQLTLGSVYNWGVLLCFVSFVHERRHSALSTQHPAPSTQHPPSTQHRQGSLPTPLLRN